VIPDSFLGQQRVQIVRLAAKYRIPAMYPGISYSEVGGLMSYSATTTDNGRRAALYVDKILKGAKPADLPVEQPTSFQMVINLRTVKELRIKIPQSLLARADRVIE
jgi:putative tryptophan/tyrosine transport system substrate-binding protein